MEIVFIRGPSSSNGDDVILTKYHVFQRVERWKMKKVCPRITSLTTEEASWLVPSSEIQYWATFWQSPPHVISWWDGRWSETTFWNCRSHGVTIGAVLVVAIMNICEDHEGSRENRQAKVITRFTLFWYERKFEKMTSIVAWKWSFRCIHRSDVLQLIAWAIYQVLGLCPVNVQWYLRRLGREATVSLLGSEQ